MVITSKKVFIYSVLRISVSYCEKCKGRKRNGAWWARWDMGRCHVAREREKLQKANTFNLFRSTFTFTLNNHNLSISILLLLFLNLV